MTLPSCAGVGIVKQTALFFTLPSCAGVGFEKEAKIAGVTNLKRCGYLPDQLSFLWKLIEQHKNQIYHQMQNSMKLLLPS